MSMPMSPPMSATAHITSFLILCKPQHRDAVRDAAANLRGVEIHHCGDNGKIVAVAEGSNESHIADALQALQTMPGVIAANLVYHGIADDTADDIDIADEHGG